MGENNWDVNAAAAQVLAPKAPAAVAGAPAKKGPSLLDKVRGYTNAATKLANPMQGAFEAVVEPRMALERAKAGVQGLRQKETDSEDPEAQALNVAGRYGPGLAATAMFPAAKVADLAGIAALRYAPALGRMGGHAARLATGMGTAGATAGLGTLAASTAAGDPAVDESIQTGKEYAAGEGALGALQAGVPPVWRGAKALGAGAVERSSRLIGGTTAADWETLKVAGDKVAGYARRGMTKTLENKPIARAMETAQGLVQGVKDKASAITQAAREKANAFGASAQEKIGKMVRGEGSKYDAMMTHLHEDVSGDKFDIAGKVYDRMEPYIKRNVTLRGAGAAEGPTKRLLDIYGDVKNSLAEGMAPGEAADIMQELTAIQRDNAGKTVSAHARELKKMVEEALPGEYRFPTPDTPTPKGWSIRETRAGYAGAKQLERDAKKFAVADNPSRTLENLEKAGGKTARVLKRASGEKGIPGFGEDIANMKAAQAAAGPEISAAQAAAQPEINAAKAGAAFAPIISDKLPRTGLMAGVGATLYKAFHGDPIALAALPFEALGVSPRLAMETRLAASKGANALEKFTEKNASKFPAIVANALKAAREKKDKK